MGGAELGGRKEEAFRGGGSVLSRSPVPAQTGSRREGIHSCPLRSRGRRGLASGFRPAGLEAQVCVWLLWSWVLGGDLNLALVTRGQRALWIVNSLPETAQELGVFREPRLGKLSPPGLLLTFPGQSAGRPGFLQLLQGTSSRRSADIPRELCPVRPLQQRVAHQPSPPLSPSGSPARS